MQAKPCNAPACMDRTMWRAACVLTLCLDCYTALQVDPGVAPEVERHLIDKIGYKVREGGLPVLFVGQPAGWIASCCLACPCLPPAT